MSTSLIYINHKLPSANWTAGATFQSSAGNSWYIHPFRAYQSEIINRFQFYTGSITNTNNFTVTVGIGTMDANTGTAYTSAVNTLAFIGSTTLSALSQNSLITAGLINDVTTVAGQKYYIGWLVNQVSPTFTFNLNISQCSLTAQAEEPDPSTPQQFLGANPVYLQTSVNNPISGKHMGYNWGYDAGNGVTAWYNKMPGQAVYITPVTATLTNMQGFTFCLDTDLEGIYSDSVCIYALLANSFAAVGHTYGMTLYDSDGTTALVATTTCVLSNNQSQRMQIIFPVQTWLKNRKIYHFAFWGDHPTSANSNVRTATMPYTWQAGFPITSVNFTKTSGAGSPTYNIDTNMLFSMHITNLRGNIQNNPGTLNVY